MTEKTVTVFVAKTEQVLTFKYTSESTVGDLRKYVRKTVGFGKTNFELMHLGVILEDEGAQIANMNLEAMPYILVHVPSAGRQKRKGSKLPPLSVNGMQAAKIKEMLESNAAYFPMVLRKIAGGDPDIMETLAKNQDQWMQALHIDVERVQKLRSMEDDKLALSQKFTKRFSKYPRNFMNLATGEHVPGEPYIEEEEEEEEEEKKSEGKNDSDGEDGGPDIRQLLLQLLQAAGN